MQLYRKLADEISGQIRSGVLRAGDRLPSVRSVARSHKLSVATAMKAFADLESRGHIHTRPRSGHFVSANWAGPPPEPAKTNPPPKPQKPIIADLILEILAAMDNPRAVVLGSTWPSPDLFPLQKLARALHVATMRLPPSRMVAHMIPGDPELRRLIARQYLESGIALNAGDIVITAGATEAIRLCLQAATKPGDLVAIESPTVPALLEAVERMNLRAVEIPTSCSDGIDLAALDSTLNILPIRACCFTTTFQNPVGALMPENKKRELVRLLEKYDVPLIEDDVCAEIYCVGERPRPAKSFDRKGLVMHVSSFSKCLAPGYRVGWVAPGRYLREVERAKVTTTIATSVPVQVAIVEFLKHGGYRAHLRRLRKEIAARQVLLTQAVLRHFPADVKVTRPHGGYALWVELSEKVDALAVFHEAMAKHIMVAPGQIFSPRRRFANFIRLNYSVPWSAHIDHAVATLADIICAQKDANCGPRKSRAKGAGSPAN